MYLRYVTFLVVFCCVCISSAEADCVSPQYPFVSDVTHQSASLYWTYWGSNQPTYQVQWRTAGSTSWRVESPVNTSSLSLTGLVNNTSYEWRVRTICAAGDTSSFSSSSSFQTICRKPDYLSTNRIDLQSTQLWWSNPYGPGTYEVQWRSVGATSWNVIENIVTNYVTLVSLPLDTYFEWRVRKVCGNGAYSDFVSGQVFNTPCLVPINPAVDIVSTDAAELKWTSSLSGTRFDLQWRQVGASTWNVVENVSGTDYILTGLTNETTYEWQVRASCSATSKSDYTDRQTFRTRCSDPVSPAILSVTYNGATLAWSPVAPVNLQWRKVGESTWNTVPAVQSTYALENLAPNSTYECRIQTICVGSTTSNYSPINSFSTRCAIATSLYAFIGSDGALELNWISGNRDLFDLQWRPVGATEWSTRKVISGSPYILTGLSAGVFYEWRVRRICSATEFSEFAVGQSVLMPCVTPNSLRQENATGNSAELAWNDAPGGTYELQWRQTNTTAWNTVSGLASTRYTLTGLTNNSSYEWRLRKSCSPNSSSDYTYISSFTIHCQQPAVFTTTNVDYSSATVNWYGDYYLTGTFELQYRLSGTTDWTSIPNLASISYTLNGLLGNRDYEWRVRSTCSVDFSAIQTFTTQCNLLLSALTVQNVGINSAELRWESTNKASQYEIQYRALTSSDWLTIRPEINEVDPGNEPSYSNQKRYIVYGLEPGKIYAWRIRARCIEGVYSGFIDGVTFTTSCAVPVSVYGFQQSHSALIVNWGGPTLLATYDLQWRPAGASVWNLVSNITARAYKITDLSAGTTYEFRVRQWCSDGSVSAYSATSTYTLPCRSPFSISATVTSATSLLLTWNYFDMRESTLATRLQDIRYRVAGTEAWTTIAGIPGTSYSLTGLTAGSTYEYQIRTICQPGVSSEYLSGYSYQLSCLPIYSTSSSVGPTSAKLAWSAPVNTGYRLRWRVAGTANWVEHTVANTNYTLTGLANNTRYEWSVASDCGNGFLSDFSTIQAFQTTCPTITYLSTNGAGSTKVQLSWSVNGLTEGTTFTVQYRILGTVIWSELNSLTRTSVTLTGLVNNRIYEARVKLMCGNEQQTSSSTTFQVECSNPYVGNPSTITTQTARITWTPNIDKAPVDIQWRNMDSDQEWQYVSSVSGEGYELTGLTPATNYAFRLRSVCSMSDMPLWSSPILFKTLSAPGSTPGALFAYVYDVTGQSASVSWTDESTTATYVVQWRESNGSWNTSGPISTKVYMLSNLTYGRNYEVRVGYVSTDNTIVYGNISRFITYCYPVQALSAGTITSRSALLNWSDGRDNISFTIEWRLAGTSAWNVVTGIVSRTYSLTGLQNNSVYEWRVRAPCTDNSSNISYTASFRTICPMPTESDVLNVSSSSAKLMWTGGGPAYELRYRALGEPNWVSVANVMSTTYALTGLQTGTTYEWGVATRCETTGNTTYTSPLQFKTVCSQPSELYVYPFAPDRARLSWTGIEPSYLLQYRAVGASTWTNVPAVTSPFTLTGLNAGVDYEWRVRASCSADFEKSYSVGSPFSVACWDINIQGRTATMIMANSVSLTWEAKLLMNYQLRWRIQGTPSWSYSPPAITSPYNLTGLSNNTTYEWQIATECQPNFSGGSLVFRTSCNRPLVLRTKTLTTTAVQLAWNDSGENVAYELRWRQTGSSTWHTVSGISSLSYSLTGLSSSMGYEWQVRSQCSGGSDFLITATFRTADDCQLGTYTIRSGDWNDPAVWSCGRIPIATDRIQIKHTISIPSGLSATIASVRYDTDGKLIVGVGAGIKIAGEL